MIFHEFPLLCTTLHFHDFARLFKTLHDFPRLSYTPPALHFQSPHSFGICEEGLLEGCLKGHIFLVSRCPFFAASRRPKSPFGNEIYFGGIEILQSVVQHQDRLHPGVNPVRVSGASTSCTVEVKKYLDTEKKIE